MPKVATKLANKPVKKVAKKADPKAKVVMSKGKDDSKITSFLETAYETQFMPAIKEFIRIPSLSPLYDEHWQENQALMKQCAHLQSFVKAQDLKGCEMIVLKEPNRTPFLIVKIAAFNTDSSETVLMYGHMDKQPFGEGWDTDPCDPVIKDGRLYGRGSGDDGYSLFSAVLAVKACQQANASHPKCVITIEGSEEGEIDDLLYYMSNHKDKLDNPTLVICIDSGAFTEETLTITSSLRGCATFDLSVAVASNNLHSGIGGGICPNVHNIMNSLLMRLQDYNTQEVIDELQTTIPDYRIQELGMLAKLAPEAIKGLPMLATTETLAQRDQDGQERDETSEALQLLKNNFWKSQLAVIGIQGFPNNLSSAGNTLYKELKYRLSMRLAPNLNCEKAVEIIREKVTADGPETFGAQIKFDLADASNGFDAPDLKPAFKLALGEAIEEVFGEGKPPLYAGIGGSIPFMEVFQQQFPSAQFILTGVGFPDSNFHAANENLRLDFCKKFIKTLGVMLSKI